MLWGGGGIFPPPALKMLVARNGHFQGKFPWVRRRVSLKPEWTPGQPAAWLAAAWLAASQASNLFPASLFQPETSLQPHQRALFILLLPKGRWTVTYFFAFRDAKIGQKWADLGWIGAGQGKFGVKKKLFDFISSHNWQRFGHF